MNTNGLSELEQVRGDEPGRAQPRPFRHAGPGPAGGAAKWRLPAAASGCDPARRGFAAPRRPCKGSTPQKGTVRAASPGDPLGTQRHASARRRTPPRVKAPRVPARLRPAAGDPRWRQQGAGLPRVGPAVRSRSVHAGCGPAARSLSSFQRLTLKRCAIIHPEDTWKHSRGIKCVSNRVSKCFINVSFVVTDN